MYNKEWHLGDLYETYIPHTVQVVQAASYILLRHPVYLFETTHDVGRDVRDSLPRFRFVTVLTVMQRNDNSNQSLG